MDFYTGGRLSGQNLLDFLQLVDGGYVPSKDELNALEEIYEADFTDLDLDFLPESIGMLSQLTKLNVSNNRLEELPESICKLSKLTDLKASENQLDELPEHIGALSALKLLDVSSNQLASLPVSIRDLSVLTRLNISGNELVSLPESVVSLPQLTELNVSMNELTSLPERIGMLSRLEALDAFGNEIEQLPESIGTLSHLLELDVSMNGLTSLPESLASLSRLSELRIYNNELTGLPEHIGELSNLTLLDMSDNQLASLPDSICRLFRLMELDISNNQLTGLPDNIYELSQLEEFNVSGNQLTSLPESICELSQLTELNVSDNQLASLPENIGELSSLTNLDISENHLASLPASAGELFQLIILRMYDNQLTSLPEYIGNLYQLTELDVSDNPMEYLPESIGRLLGLAILMLSGLRLREVPPCIRDLSGLKILDLSGNPMKTLPDWLGDLTMLTRLNLSRLQLTEFPCALLKLGLPFVRDNGFRYFGGDREGIHIDDTELSIQPISLFDQSRDRSPDFRQSRNLIEDYFKTPKIPIREAKVIFLGDGKVGKTYTIQRLLHDCRRGEYHTEETHGILIEDLCAEQDGESYKIRVWDFGGQDIMHEMHRCFLTDRTCYVVMVDTRADKQTGRARYWLRTVQSIAPRAPTLLLVNEISGGQNRDLDYSSLEREFSNLVGVRYCSSMNASDEEFREKVECAIFRQALNLDSCKMELPESWEKVRQSLLSLHNSGDPGQKTKYYIDRQTFHNLCDQYSVPKNDGLRAWLLTWFNDLGVCFSYHLGEDGQEQAADYKILDPMWLTSAVYKIIWEKERTEDGLIQRSEIYRILERPGSDAMKKDGIPCLENVSYNQRECGYVLEIMRRFRISYPADRGTEFMPTLCKPDSNMEPIPQSYRQHAAYQFRYTFLPENVLHRLMIYCFANLRPGKRWRKGFWLECEAQGLSAVIRTTGRDSEENELQVDVYAQTGQFEAWTWLQPICRQITEINNTLSLKAEVYILGENEYEKKWFPLNSLWYWRNQGESMMQGERSKFPIQGLMNLIYGRYYPEVEKKLVTELDPFQLPVAQEAFPQHVTTMVADLTGLNLSQPLERQLANVGKNFLTEWRRSNDLRERAINVMTRQTAAMEENTFALQENTWSLQKSTELLTAIRDGEVELPEELMAALTGAFQRSNNPELQEAAQKMGRGSWKGKMQMLRDFLGDASNLATVGPVLVQLGKDYGPVLLELLKTVLPV